MRIKKYELNRNCKNPRYKLVLSVQGQSDLKKYFDFMIAYDERMISGAESDKMRTFYDGCRAAFDCAKDAVDQLLPAANCVDQEVSWLICNRTN